MLAAGEEAALNTRDDGVAAERVTELPSAGADQQRKRGSLKMQRVGLMPVAISKSSVSVRKAKAASCSVLSSNTVGDPIVPEGRYSNNTQDSRMPEGPQVEAETEQYDISLCVSLLSMFDFDGDRLVSKDDWRRGARSMNLGVLADDDSLWEILKGKFSQHDSPSMVSVDLIDDLNPIDPRLSLLLRAIYHSVVVVSDRVDGMQGALASQADVKQSRVLLNIQLCTLGPVFVAWVGQHRKERELRYRVFRRMSRSGLAKAFASLSEFAAERQRVAHFVCWVAQQSQGWAWAKWRVGRVGAAERRRKQRFRAGFARRLLASAFGSWTDRLASVLRLEAAHLSHCAAGVHRALTDRYLAGEAAAQRGLAPRTLIAISGQSRALRHWVERTHELRRLRRFLQRMLRRSLALAWSEWQSSRRANLRMRRFVSRLMRRQLACRFDMWVRSKEELVATFGLQRWAALELNRAFRSWLGVVGDRGKLQATE